MGLAKLISTSRPVSGAELSIISQGALPCIKQGISVTDIPVYDWTINNLPINPEPCRTARRQTGTGWVHGSNHLKATYSWISGAYVSRMMLSIVATSPERPPSQLTHPRSSKSRQAGVKNSHVSQNISLAAIPTCRVLSF
jgi:hypothetical protein